MSDPASTAPAAPAQERQLFGAFAGVFTPTLLTILGVLAGLLGATFSSALTSLAGAPRRRPSPT